MKKPIFSKRHYEFLAKHYKGRMEMSWCIDTDKEIIAEVSAMVESLEKDNPRFDKRKFYKACGLDI
jgi:hypothetical protein